MEQINTSLKPNLKFDGLSVVKFKNLLLDLEKTKEFQKNKILEKIKNGN